VQGAGQFVGGAPDPGFFAAVAELAEELGYDSIWAGEHLSFENPILDLGVALSVFAARTRRIALGAGVVLLPLRHPSLVAKQFASLDHVSGGRVLLGVGAGGEGAKDFEAAGVPLGERGARTDDALRALRALFGPAPACYRGRFSSFEGVTIEPRSPRPGGPPLLVGGRSDAALRRAGTLGDGWLPYMISPERYREGWAVVRAHAGAAGRDPDALLPGCVLFARVGDPEQTRRHLSLRYGMEFRPDHVERLCLAGEPERCVERIREYIDAGVRHFSFNLAVPAGELLAECERLRRTVLAMLTC
jgi:probable F420-dependent oxidoreductase